MFSIHFHNEILYSSCSIECVAYVDDEYFLTGSDNKWVYLLVFVLCTYSRSQNKDFHYDKRNTSMVLHFSKIKPLKTSTVYVLLYSRENVNSSKYSI